MSRAVLTLALLLALAGCGGQQAAPTAQPTTSAPTAVAQPTAAPTAQPTPEPTSAAPTAAPTAAVPAAEISATIKLFVYRPAELEVAPNTAVTWTNEDDIGHSVTHGTPDSPGADFDSGLFELGGSFTHVFTAPGEYDYFCSRHPSMVGKVIVAP